MDNPPGRFPAGTRFLAVFLTLFSVMQLALLRAEDTAAERVLIDAMTVAPAGQLLAVLYPDDRVRTAGRKIISSEARLTVRPGCEGTELYLLLIAAVLAFPASWRKRLTGVAAGLLVAFLLNQTRLLALYIALRDHGRHFELMHAYVTPVAAVALLVIAFVYWSSRAAATPVSK